jgi:type I restriction enzyme S subunit
MAGDRVQLPLGEVCQVKQGKYLAPGEMSEIRTAETPIPVYGANGILGYTDKVMYDEPVSLVTCRGSNCGMLQRTDGQAWISNNAMACPPTPPNKSRYVHYVLVASNFGDVTTGSAQPQITAGHLNTKPLTISTDPDEQQAIAGVLGSLDDKIELNRRMNETLEALAQTIFKSWFVDAAVTKLPKGWRESKIGELASNIQYGLTQSASTEPVGPRFLRITDIQGGRVDWGSVPFCKVSPEEHKRYRLKPGDVLVARTGASTGENIYLPVVPDAVFASYLVRFQFAEPAMARFVGAFMRTPAYFDFVAGCISGSAQPNASAQVLARAELPVPPPELVRRFAEVVAPVDKRIAANSEESRTLAALRDALLPKLLSGELRVPAAHTKEAAI